MVKRKNNPNTRCKVCGRRVCRKGEGRLCDDPRCEKAARQIDEAHATDDRLRRMAPSIAARPFWVNDEDGRHYDTDLPARLAPPVLHGLLTAADVRELERRRRLLRIRLAA